MTFVLNLSGYEAPRLTAGELRALFHQGIIDRSTPCRGSRSSMWSTLDDIFPMLKYEPRRGVRLSRSAGPIRRCAENLKATATFSELLRLLGTPV